MAGWVGAAWGGWQYQHGGWGWKGSIGVEHGGWGGRAPSELVAAGGLGKGLGFGLKLWRCSEDAARGW